MPVKLTRWPKKTPPQLRDLEAGLRAEGYRTYIYGDSAGARYGDHEHAYTEVRWVLSGRITIGVGKETFTLGPGDRLDMPPRAVHWAEVPAGAPVRYLCGEK